MHNILIDGNFVSIETTKDSRKTTKVTNLQSFREAVGINDNSYDSGILPGNHGIKRIKENNEYVKVAYLEPEQKREIIYVPGYEDEEYTVIFPKTMLLFYSGKNSNNKYVKVLTPGNQSIITGDEILYRYPAPNIYDTDMICWGYNSIPPLDSVLELQGIMPKFFSNKFNSDLAFGRVSNQSFSDFWELMNDKIYEGESKEDILSLYNDILFSSTLTMNSFFDQE